jgi:hypothetical protein
VAHQSPKTSHRAGDTPTATATASALLTG